MNIEQRFFTTSTGAMWTASQTKAAKNSYPLFQEH